MSKKIFVCRPIPEVGLNLLAAEGHQVMVHPGPLPPTRDELTKGVLGCDAVLSLLSDRIDAQIMDAAGPQLKVIANFAVGFNNIDLGEASRRGIRVGNTPDVLTDATADIAVGLALAASRLFGAGIAAVKNGGWRTWEPLGWIGQDLQGKSLGIVGMGRIGTAVAQRLHFGWNMPVLYTARDRKPDADSLLEARQVELDQLLAESDIISLHVPLNERTRNLIGEPQFRMMKPTSVLINTARGEIVDQTALVDALSSRRIFAAGLDVCTPEPLPLDHLLHRLENCILLPHIGSATTTARNLMATRAAQNLVAGLSNQPLPFPVN